MRTTEALHERQLLAAARAGDEHAFRALVAPRGRELHAHCYRMLGSVDDADDAMQDVLLRAWRALDRFEGRSSLRLWLHRIATNACLNALEGRGRRGLPVDPETIAEADPLWLEPYPEALDPSAGAERRETLELAFVVALQELPPRQRAALLLRDVLGFTAREAAAALDTTPAAINSALQHARARLQERLPERSQQEALRALGDTRLQALVSDYTGALERGDVDAILALLADDATWSMPPLPDVFRGHAEIAGFLRAGPGKLRWRHLPARANGQPAVGCYAWDPDAGRFTARVLDVLAVREDRIAAVVAFLGAEPVLRCGLPRTLP
jgi:RNA polymerase sigma-70 factor (ECF subfamily)